MTGAPMPRMHGLTHVCGGPDPIPGLCDLLNSGFASYRDCVLATNPVAYWPMDEASGNIVDLVSGVELTATAAGGFPDYGENGPFFADHPERTAILFGGTEGTGVAGTAARFSDNVPTELANIFAASASFTVDLWCYFVAYASVVERRLFQNWSQVAASNVFAITSDTSGVISVVKGSDSVSSTAIPLTTWTHVRAVFDGTTDDLSLYINTELVDTVTAADVISGGAWIVGNCDTTGVGSSEWRPFSGRLSDLSVWDSALTEFCPTVTTEGPGSEGAAAGTVLTADGTGGTSWEFPTIEVEY